MGRLDLPDKRRDEDELPLDRQWTSITVAHRNELYRKADRVRTLEARVAELEAELARVRDQSRQGCGVRADRAGG